MKETHKKILAQMFDVRPVDESGNLDLEKIKRGGRVIKIEQKEKKRTVKIVERNNIYDVREPDPHYEEIKRFQQMLLEEEKIRQKERLFQLSQQNISIDVDCDKRDVFEESYIDPRLENIPKPPVSVEFDFSQVPEFVQKEIPVQVLKPKRIARPTVVSSPINSSDIAPSNSKEKTYLPKQKEISTVLPEKKCGFGSTNFREGNSEETYLRYLEKPPVSPRKRLPKKSQSIRKKLDRLFSFSDDFTLSDKKYQLTFGQSLFSFASASIAIVFVLISLGLLGRGLKIKTLALENGQEAYASLIAAKEGVSDKNFQESSVRFQEAHIHFNEISQDLDSLGKIIVTSSKYLPYLSKLSSGKHLAEAGKDISQIGVLLSQTMQTLDQLKNPLDTNNDQPVSLLKLFENTEKNLKEISTLAKRVEKNIEEVNADDLPEEQRKKFVETRNKLPQINSYLDAFLEEEKVFVDILGGNGPRKYLFLFQNNQEMRATGGFIGTYAVLDIFNGNVRNFFVDGIFNPDGQLKEKVIPPAPIQKISAAWSLHDSNWFPDFPASAEKSAWFYEKTGGPTVDGIITMTPTVMQRLLEITGPIEMPEYQTTIDKDNFIEQIQYEVEVDYDKEENKPKKILGDLAPKILDRIFNARNVSDVAKTMNILVDSLNEKHILIYSKNYEIEKMIPERGWSGEILDTQKDYLSVINTNINGYKTDGMIDERIEHQAEIQDDGSIIDTVTITRHHRGGDMEYDWWNKVNADYMRVYVPKGSQLISANGQTREFNSPPLDYSALGFKNDPQIKMEEDATHVDEESGTRIYEDSNKTVFANWVYVSPQETAKITYRYLLPFRIDPNQTSRPADTYSLLAQKQSGSLGSHFQSKIIHPKSYETIWKYPSESISSLDDLPENQNGTRLEIDLTVDRFIGVAFSKKNNHD